MSPESIGAGRSHSNSATDSVAGSGAKSVDVDSRLTAPSPNSPDQLTREKRLTFISSPAIYRVLRRMKKVYRRKNRSVSLLFAHMVFCSKYRRKVFTPAVFARLRKSFERTARMLEIDLLAVEADRDHVHLMISFPPRLALSTIAQRLKGAASREVRAQKYPEIRRVLWGGRTSGLRLTLW